MAAVSIAAQEDASRMSQTLTRQKGTRQKDRFHLTESAQEHRLDGVRLASFWQRLLGYFVDLMMAVILWFPAEWGYRWYVLHERAINIKFDFHETGNIVVMLLYWGLGNYFSNGRTPGKWVARTRVVSLTSDRMGLWQSFERALGYGAAVLEGGLGFLQVFWAHNRQCAQDRLAETIVVDARRHEAKSTPK
jgi:uncharacterized RDD family membrane protein YckC